MPKQRSKSHMTKCITWQSCDFLMKHICKNVKPLSLQTGVLIRTGNVFLCRRFRFARQVQHYHWLLKVRSRSHTRITCSHFCCFVGWRFDSIIGLNYSKYWNYCSKFNCCQQNMAFVWCMLPVRFSPFPLSVHPHPNLYNCNVSIVICHWAASLRSVSRVYVKPP